MRQKVWFLVLTGLILTAVSVAAQTIRNPRLSASDLEAAKDAAKSAQGPDAELVYATRVDAIEKGKLNCLVVVSAATAGTAKAYVVQVIRDGSALKLVAGESGNAVASGDRFLKIGLRHEDGKAPILRVMSATREKGSGDERQRNLDFQYQGTEFALVGQSVTSIAR
jgi:hypothetical protein